MAYLLAKATVDDIETWKSSFESNDPFRTEHGQRGYQVFQSGDESDEIVVLFEWDEAEDPLAFFGSDEMRERMTDAGVKGTPEMSVVELIDQKSSVESSP